MENNSQEISIITDRPVADFPMKFSWQDGDWVSLFNEQIDLIREDVARARMQGRLVIYLSCPISSRGGGYAGTNVEIAEFTRMALLKEWGTGFWILNPANYQMESKGGTGLMHRHAKELWGEEGEARLNELVEKHPAKDGDYMRMWTKILVENDKSEGKENSGYNIDGYYFMSPSDIRKYFLNSDNGDLTSSIQNYFTRKFATDADFRNYYSMLGIDWGSRDKNDLPYTAITHPQKDLIKKWDRLRLDFFRFYSLRASVNYSSGAHDEWNIWNLINKKRIEYFDSIGKHKEGIGDLMPGYFEGRQIAMGELTIRTQPGYEAL